MTLDNLSLDNRLLVDGDTVSTIEITSPTLFSRFVQSFVAMENGDEPKEPLALRDGEKVLNAEKLLYTVTDPFSIDPNSKKTTTLLYSCLYRLLTEDHDLHMRWSALMLKISSIIESLAVQIGPNVRASRDEAAFADICKSIDLRFEFSKEAEPIDRLLMLFDMIAEFMPERVVVLCNIRGYMSDENWLELLRYSCYTKIKVIILERMLPDKLYEHESRWIIDENFDDRIVNG